MKLTAYGRREWANATIIAGGSAVLLGALAGFDFISETLVFYLLGLLLLAWLVCAGFFRDPVRRVPDDATMVLSPADGTIRDIELIKNESVGSDELRELFRGRDMLRIGIAVSVFNVRIFRAPAAMNVRFLKNGRNASVLIGAEADADGAPWALAVRLLATSGDARIVCAASADSVLAAGEKFGMLKRGSRAELYLPAGMGFELAVKVGDTATGGVTPLAGITMETKNKLTLAKAADETPQN